MVWDIAQYQQGCKDSKESNYNQGMKIFKISNNCLKTHIKFSTGETKSKTVTFSFERDPKKPYTLN